MEQKLNIPITERDTVTAGTRCCWEVHAGIIPGQPMPEHTRRWVITSEVWELENNMSEAEFKEAHPDGWSTFWKFRDAAYEYARALNDPRCLNWVRVEWVWF